MHIGSICFTVGACNVLYWIVDALLYALLVHIALCLTVMALCNMPYAYWFNMLYSWLLQYALLVYWCLNDMHYWFNMMYWFNMIYWCLIICIPYGLLAALWFPNLMGACVWVMSVIPVLSPATCLMHMCAFRLSTDIMDKINSLILSFIMQSLCCFWLLWVASSSSRTPVCSQLVPTRKRMADGNVAQEFSR